MKIAFTHNLRVAHVEEEAEFDTPETVAALTGALSKLGHDVEQVEVSGPASRTVARLEALNPDLVFNTAEGRGGRFREAFYPGLFDQLAIPYTGSDAYVCLLTLDKQLTKMMVAAHGVPTPRWTFVDDLRDFAPPDLDYPVIVKPNFEGSSKGVTVDSIVESPADLMPRLHDELARYPAGVLVEEFIVGRDIVVPFLEKAPAAPNGVLCAAEYGFPEEVTRSRKYQIYDYELKNAKASEGVTVRAPAELPNGLADELARLSRVVYKVLGVRDLGRIDYRVTPDGRPYFIEINALPSLEPGAGIYVSAARAGLSSVEEVLAVILQSAAERQGVQMRASSKPRRKTSLRIGFTYNLKRVIPTPAGSNDQEAEYDAPKTIDAVRSAIRSYGHEVIDLEATSELPTLLLASNVDLVFNMAEGIKGRNREALIPAICELMDIPYSGSDSATLALALDKGLAKRIVRQVGIATPEWVVMSTGKERLPKNLRYPVVAKPLAEGSSKGVVGTSVCETEAELRDMVREMTAKYQQPTLVEEYLVGREFTVALLGERRPKVLPPMEIVFVNRDMKHPVYSFEYKQDWSKDVRYDAPAEVEPALGREIERAARAVFAALDCRDVARIDLRLDAAGRVNFIECNPLPGLTPDWSDLCMIAKSAGMDYRTLIGEILAPAIKRYRERERQRLKQEEPKGNGS